MKTKAEDIVGVDLIRGITGLKPREGGLGRRNDEIFFCVPGRKRNSPTDENISGIARIALQN